MTDIEQAARARSAAKYPLSRYEPTLASGAVRNARREAFEHGASWLAEYLLSGEAVERAARVTFEPEGASGEYTWAEMVAEDPSRADIWRSDARAALAAALGTNHESGSK